MIQQGQFNTDTTALKRRIEAHGKYGSKDLNEWIFDHLELREGLSICDLGCGTGKQTLPMTQAVGDTGRVLAVDLSQEALRELSEGAANLGLQKRVTVLCCALDDFDGQVQGQAFDIVLSSYSLYYVQNPAKLFRAVHRILKPGGLLFFCGPTKTNNLELKQFHWSLAGQPMPAETGAAVFMEDTGQKLARALFGRVEVFAFDNTLRFDSPEALYSYWSSYNLYEAKLDEVFKVAAAKYFQIHPVFETMKRAIGVKAVRQ